MKFRLTRPPRVCDQRPKRMGDHDAILLLEDGRAFRGQAYGAPGEALGEVVFNTSMTGYQEIVSDPSYCGQIVTFTAPQIGNYGVTPDDDQAEAPALSGVVLRAPAPRPSSWRAQGHFGDWLAGHGVVAICDLDTRALTRHLRDEGAMRGGIFPAPADGDVTALLARVRAHPSLTGADLATRVTTARPYAVGERAEARGRVALIDFGVKRGIVHSLTRRGLAVDVLPAGVDQQTLLQHGPAGLVLSNGPGDPAAVATGIETARALLGKLPMLGICLGHQILALAMGGRTFKLPFGHHGGNHPVLDTPSGQVWITAQNHGFAVDPDSLPADRVEVSCHSLFDQTCEGFRSRADRVLAVQFHPEACPGPSDAALVFDRFVSMLEA